MRLRTPASVLAVSLACAFGHPRAAFAQARDLRWDPAVDLTVTGVDLSAWISAELLEPVLAPAHCRWCGAGGLDREVRDDLVWSHPATADSLSDVTGFALAPMAAIGLDALAASHDRSIHNLDVDTLLVLEAAVIAANVNVLTKLLVGRARPFVHTLDPDEKALTARPSDNNMSFFSGHATEAFAFAAAAGTVATMRGYRWAPAVWGAGSVVAVATGYLRIAADKHWLTDVVVGMLVGAGIGFGVPYLFHRPEPNAMASPGLAMPPPGTGSVTLVW